ncbi:MAG: TonB-dependent receptor [Chitinophagaceae bacterium]
MKKTNCLTDGALLAGRLCLFFCWSLAIAWMLMPQQLMAQQKSGKTISGTVYNQEGAPLAGASITVKGEKAARTTTDLNGNFTISVAPATTTLVISFVGATPKEVSVVNQTAVTATLEVADVKLSEVVVIGYGKMKKTDLSSAQVSISEQDINKTVNSTLDQAIQGRAAGVYVTQNSGQPGGGISVNIRGVSTLTGTTQPLYVIDGVQIQPDLSGSSNDGRFGSSNALAGINPSDIESIEILQGPSATAIYGTRATNGVVLITTKKGRKNQRVKLSYGFLGTLQAKPKQLSTLDLQQWATMKNVSDSILGFTPNVSLSDPSVLGDGTNWQTAMFKRAPMFKHQLSATGGTERTTFYASGEYFQQDGVAVGSDFKRYSFRLNIDNQTTSWLKLGASVNLWSTKEKLSTTNEDVIRDALTTAPNLPVKNPDGSWAGATTVEFGSNAQYAPRNPIAMASIIKNYLDRDGLLGGAYAELKPMKHLTLRVSFDGNKDSKLAYTYTPEFFFGLNNNNPQATLFTEPGRNYYWNFNQLVRYERNLGKTGRHWVGAMVSHEAQEWSYKGTPAMYNMVTKNRSGIPYKGSGALESYLGRVNYSFDDKYIVQAAIRADGSANFTEENRWGYFPSASVAWRVSKEKFLQEVAWLNELKLRAEYGATGNPYQSGIYTAYRPTWTAFDTAYRVGNFGNPDLTWELTKTANFGINLNMFKNRVQIEADVFDRTTDNLLYRNDGLPAYLGTTGSGGIGAPIVNFGSLKTKGFAITINTVNIDNRAADFIWRSNFNISHFKSTIQSTFAGKPLYSTAWWMNDFMGQSAVGQAPWVFYGYVAEKLFESVDEINKSAVPVQSDGVTRLPANETTGVWVGDIKYRDINGDGLINEKDQTVIGNPWPKYTFGFTNSFSYKNFDLNILVIGTVGNDVYNYMRYNMANPNGVNIGRNLFSEAFDFARINTSRTGLVNPGTTVPRITAADVNGNAKRINSFFVEDGSFVRIKNVTLGYVLPTRWLRETGFIRAVRLQAGVQNLATFTKYKGFDPEIGTYVGKNVGGADRIFQGVDAGRYPLTRTYTFSVNVDF